VNDELVHGIPGPRRLQEGDIVSIDCGSVVDGFVGDSAITVGVGKVSEEAQRLLDVTCAALFAGIQYMRAGGRTGDVSAAIQAQVERHAFHVVGNTPGTGWAGKCTRARRCRITALRDAASLCGRV
jgi:methionyl aminopeptidase